MNITKIVIEVIKDVSGKNPSDYREQDLFKSGVLDSLAIMQMIGELDDQFEIEIDVDDIVADNFNTIDHIVALVKKYID